MKISVILCTYNRSQVLANALESIAALILPDGMEWEVLVIDNNSKDRTREVVEEFRKRYPGRFRYLFEPRQGKSYALNFGIREARGEILAFVDDDVTVAPTWLRELTAPLCNGECSGAGGRILPRWSSPPPQWLPVKEPYALGPFAVFDLGPEACRLGEPPFGTNMAFKKEVFSRYGTFRTDLGRCGTGLISNEDTEFGRRLLSAGEVLLYEPSAVVYHPVLEERLRKGYVLRWWFGKGRADVRELGIRPGSKYFFRGIPLYLFRNLVRWLLRWMFSTNLRKRFYAKSTVWGKLGEIMECYHARRTEGYGKELKADR